MARQYSSFLVRCWQQDNGTQRIEIEHIQSGDKTLVASMAAVVDWICARPGAPPDCEDAVAGSWRGGSTDDIR